MEKVTKKLFIEEKESFIKMMEKFEWNLVSTTEKGKKVILTFERDNETPYYDELTKIESKAQFKVIPNFALLILMIIAISLMTSFIVVSKVQGESFDTLMWFAILFVPALLCLAIMVVISFIRNKQITNFVNEQQKTKREINDQLQELRQRYADKDN